MNFSELNYLDVVFKQCPVHTELRYAGDKCPVCKLVEDHDLLLGKVAYELTQLEGTVAALEERLQGYKDELRL